MSQVERKAENKRSARTDAKTQRPNDDGWRGFVQLELVEADKPAVRALRDDSERLSDNVYGMVDSGYKLSFAYDTGNDSYIVSATGKRESGKNAGLTLTGRGGAIVSAMAALWYKHDTLLARDWSNAATKTGRKFDPDDVG